MGDAGPSLIIHDDAIDSIRVIRLCVNIIVPVTLYESDHVPSRLRSGQPSVYVDVTLSSPYRCIRVDTDGVVVVQTGIVAQ